MITVRTYWLAALLMLLALTTVALLVWPRGEAAPATPTATRYTGPDFPARKTTSPRSFPIRVGGDREDAPQPVTAQALPVLTGIAGGSAYLRSTATGEVQRLTRGESLDGWRLLSVRSREVVLGNGETEQRLALFAPTTSPTPAPSPAAVQPQPQPSTP